MTVLDSLLALGDYGLFALVIILFYLGNKIVMFSAYRLTRNRNLPADFTNALFVLLRFLMALIIIFVSVNVLNLGQNTVLGLSVFLGSIISFASIYTIQNFVSGVYILATEPFSVNDLVKIGNSEGVVVEISLNYTRILNFDGMIESIPNKKILGSSIINYDQRIEKQEEKGLLDILRKQFDDRELTKYTFVWGAPLINYEEMKDKIDGVCDEYASIFGYRPSYIPNNINHRFEFSFVLSADDPMTILLNKTEFLDKVSLQFH